MKINGVVVLYNPDEAIIQNINSYINWIDKLYVVDNSEIKNKLLLDKIKHLSSKCVYINNNGNQGIAHALNVGAIHAIKDKADWLLTMDQDSKFKNDEFSKMMNFLSYKRNERIGLITPFHHTAISVQPKQETEEVLITMTSGNIINLNVYSKVGGYNNDFFIDAVDWEYCLKLNSHGYKIISLNTVHLEHELGEASFHNNLFGNNSVILNYNFIRRYYITRNKLLISKLYFRNYPRICLRWSLSIFKDIKDIIFYEKDKALKLKSVLYGFIDFLANRLGKKEF